MALVPEALRAWHAGVSAWQGQSRLNDRSIGIELVNPGHEWGYRAFTDAQYAACIDLCRAILERWPIPARRVLGHSDVAPDRKQDPGELFDWPRLAAAGIGLWPAAGRRRRARSATSKRGSRHSATPCPAMASSTRRPGSGPAFSATFAPNKSTACPIRGRSPGWTAC